jgi:hypothetical protein
MARRKPKGLKGTARWKSAVARRKKYAAQRALAGEPARIQKIRTITGGGDPMGSDVTQFDGGAVADSSKSKRKYW